MSQPSGGQSGPRHRVLLVDDDPTMLRLMSKLLSIDMEVVTCTSPLQALRVLEQRPFDVVCSDYRMPGMNGVDMLRAAAQVSAWTEGGFDITFGALAEIWKFDHDQDGRVPGAAEIAAHRARVDYRAVVVDDGPGTVRLARPGVHVHLGGIGKGYAVDRAVAMLRGAGLTDFMVQAGGDLYVAGRAGDTPWRLGIQDPRGTGGEPFAVVELTDATFSTSGDYERFFVKDGVRYHHIVDPKTGEPARECRSVTIVAREAVWADGLSTGVFILGPERGMALVERLPDVDAVIVTADNRVLVSRGLVGRVEMRRSPTP